MTVAAHVYGVRRVELIRTVPVGLSDVEAALTPESIVRYEGREPTDVSTDGLDTVVTAEPVARVLEPRYVFEPVSDGYRYRRADRRLVAVETTVELAARDGSTEVRLHSTVEPRVPVSFLGWAVARRRRHALSRLLTRLCDSLR